MSKAQHTPGPWALTIALLDALQAHQPTHAPSVGSVQRARWDADQALIAKAKGLIAIAKAKGE